MEIKRTKLDLGLFYGEEFRETDTLIRKRLNKKDDKGIVLLHGLPGAGKTTLPEIPDRQDRESGCCSYHLPLPEI